MADQIPDLDAFSKELPEELLIAIGRLVTGWATTEAALSLQVGRMIASIFDLGSKTIHFHPDVFLKAADAALGSSAKAMLTQLENFSSTSKPEIKVVSTSILSIKGKRDVIAHATYGVFKSQSAFMNFGASRRNFGTTFPYDAKQINTWSKNLTTHMNDLDKLVFKSTQVNWDTIRAEIEAWCAHQHAGAQETPAHQTGQDSDLPTSLLPDQSSPR